MSPAKTGKFAGDANTPTLGRVVYGTLYQFLGGKSALTQAVVDQVVDSAIERKVLSRKYGHAQNALLLWAYEDMPNPDRPTAKALPVDLAAKLAALFAK